MKKAAKIILCILAPFFALLAAWGAFGPLNHKTQNAKNLLVLADMKDRVQAVRDFQRQNARFPDKEELAHLSRALPVRYHLYDYYLSFSPLSGDREYPKGWPSAGGWVLCFWRGEWSEYYSSWDDRYSLSVQLTAWDDYGFALSVSIVLFLLSRMPFLRKTNIPPA